MNADLPDLLTAGIVAVSCGFATLAMIVRHDLTAPRWLAVSLAGGGRWCLGAALGLGIIAFTIKLAIIATLAAAPNSTIAPLAGERAAMPDAATSLIPARPGPAAVWQALPDTAPAPPDNPTTPERVALGRRLFFDPALSGDRTIACASCHDVDGLAGADARPTARGIGGQRGIRNAPTVWNAAFQAPLFWDGRAASLEEQALGPLVNPVEMGMPSLSAVAERIGDDPSYREPFDRAFGAGTAITITAIAQAIAAYERTLVTADTPYDRFVNGDGDALTPDQRRGMWLFQSLGCAVCHSGPMFNGASGSMFNGTSGPMFNGASGPMPNGAGAFPPRAPLRALLSSRGAAVARYDLFTDRGRAAAGSRDGIWRVPSLRNVALTAPYFHNGSVIDLAEAVRVMAVTQLNAVVGDDPRLGQGFIWSAQARTLDKVERRVLSNRDVADIVAFLDALSSDSLKASAIAGTFR